METGQWFLDIPASMTGNGRRKRRLYRTREEAVAVARGLKSRIDPVSGQLIPQAPKSGLSFRDATALWCEDEELRVQTLKKRASTLEADLHRLKSLCTFFGDRDVASITDRDLAEYQAWRLNLGRKPRTINTELGTLSLVLRWAVKRGHIQEVPKTERIPVGQSVIVIPKLEEIVRVIEALPPHLKPLVRFLAETGCRKGEALNLTWDCIDVINGTVTIRSRDGWTPKTAQSERCIPLSPSLVEVIRSLPTTGRYVFAGPNPEKPIGNFRKALRRAVQEANIRRNGELVHITPQTLRKAHATWQAMRGVNESVLQDLLGHARGSRTTKKFYVHATEEAKRRAVIQLPFGEQRRT
jgi:integrase